MRPRSTFMIRVPFALIALAALALFWQSPGAASATGAGAVAAGGESTCALTTDGGVKCWGENSGGQLGDGTTERRTAPVDVCTDAACATPLSDVTTISAGEDHTCAVTNSGRVNCWGRNDLGQLGLGTATGRSTVAVDVCADAVCASPLSGVSGVTAGHGHTCARTTTGGVKCWGRNSSGQLGDGTTTRRTTPVDVTGVTGGVAAIAAGANHTCALTTAGGVKCWGRGLDGQLGDGTATTNRTTPVDVQGLDSGVLSIAAGGDHTCALTADVGVMCWGINTYGQLGVGTESDIRAAPAAVVGLSSGVAAITAGGNHTCALTVGGIKCWGYNISGQLGDGTTQRRATPVDVQGLQSGIAGVSAGGSHTCALTMTGGVKCWGYNFDGQLGHGDSGDSHTSPVDVWGFALAPGDCTGDGGEPNIVDVLRLLRRVGDPSVALTCGSGDCTGDGGDADIVDVLRLLRRVRDPSVAVTC